MTWDPYLSTCIIVGTSGHVTLSVDMIGKHSISCFNEEIICIKSWNHLKNCMYHKLNNLRLQIFNLSKTIVSLIAAIRYRNLHEAACDRRFASLCPLHCAPSRKTPDVYFALDASTCRCTRTKLCRIGFSILQRKQQYVKLKWRNGKTIEIVGLKYSYRNFKMKTVVILKVSVPDR